MKYLQIRYYVNKCLTLNGSHRMHYIVRIMGILYYVLYCNCTVWYVSIRRVARTKVGT